MILVQNINKREVQLVKSFTSFQTSLSKHSSLIFCKFKKAFLLIFVKYFEHQNNLFKPNILERYQNQKKTWGRICVWFYLLQHLQHSAYLCLSQSSHYERNSTSSTDKISCLLLPFYNFLFWQFLQKQTFCFCNFLQKM